MKTVLLAFGVASIAIFLYAQEGRRPGPPPRDDQGGEETLSTEQQAQVKAILAKYDESSLTAKDARAINDAFREADLRNGPALLEAIRAAGFNPERIGELDPPPDRDADQPPPPPERPEGDRPPRRERKNNEPPRKGAPEGRRGPGGYSIEQAISDRAQLHTIAFDGLAFLTGDFACNTFLPPGKVADYCGFQYMRDIDKNELGHNTSFVPRAANNVLYVLNDAQKMQLVKLGNEQESLLNDFALKRFPLIMALCRQLREDLPPSSPGLNREAVKKYTADLYELDGQLSYRRAEVLGSIVRSLSDKQKQYLAHMKFDNSATWPEREDQIDKRSMSHTAHVAVMTYASEMFSWYAGNVESDVYFCPERHATYFGSFFMKDIPAMGNRNYSISTSLTGDSGEAFLKALSPQQRKLVTDLVDQQRTDLEEIVATRRKVATLLREFMKQEHVDRDQVIALSRRYGELDGEISHYYTMAFSAIGKTLTTEQKSTLMKLRNLDPRFTPKGAYLYSAPIPMPRVENTDFLFTGAR